MWRRDDDRRRLLELLDSVRPCHLQFVAAAARQSRQRPPPLTSPLLSTPAQVRGRKALVIEAEFASPLGLVAEALTLKEHGVEM